MATYSTLILSSSPLAYYKLDESSGSTAADSSGNGKDLTLTNITLAQPGLRAGDASTCALFAGTATSHALRNSFTGFATTQVTISGIFKTPDLPTASMDCMVSWASASSFDSVLLRNALRPRLTRSASSVTSSGGSIFNNGSTHIAVTWRGSTGASEIWINGDLLGTATLTTTNIVSSGSLVLGQDQDSLGAGFSAAESYQGFMQDIAIFPTVLTSTIIKQQAYIALYGTGASIYSGSIVGLNQIIIHFTALVAGLGTAANFTSDNGLTISSSTADSANRSVTLVTSGMVFGETYTLTIGAGVTDGAGNALDENEIVLIYSSNGIMLLDEAEAVQESSARYLMRAYRALSSGHVWWTVTGAPDIDGSQSEFDPSELTDIVINKEFYV